MVFNEKVIYTNDYNETINLGEKIGNLLHPGDVILLDGYPLKYLAYVKRNHRWIRGDWQIIESSKDNQRRED